MTRKIDAYDDHNNLIEDEHAVIPDQGVVRVPLMMMDGKTIPDSAQAIFDQEARERAAANDGKSPRILHKPGYLPVKAVADREAREKLYDDKDAKLKDAWRNPAPAPVLDRQQQDNKKPTLPANADPYTKRDRRLEDAWRT